MLRHCWGEMIVGILSLCTYTVFSTWPSWSDLHLPTLHYNSSWPSWSDLPKLMITSRHSICLTQLSYVRSICNNHRWTRQLSCPLMVMPLLKDNDVTGGYYWMRKLTRNTDTDWLWIPIWFREIGSWWVWRVNVICSVQWFMCHLGPVRIMLKDQNPVNCLFCILWDKDLCWRQRLLEDSIQT